MANRTKLTAKKRDDFLTLLSEGHTVTHAARAIGVSRQCVYDHRADDEAFAAAMEEALIEGGEALEQEARRRAVEGVTQEKPIYSRDGKLIDTVVTTEYSDTLLIFLLKGRLPEKYKDRVQQDTTHSGEIKIKVEYGDGGS